MQTVSPYAGRWFNNVWTPLGGRIGRAGHSGFAPSVAVLSNVPYVVWCEADGYESAVFAAHWNGTSWVADANAGNANGSLGTSDAAFARQPSLAVVGGVLYAAWAEMRGVLMYGPGTVVVVKHLSGGTWVPDGEFTAVGSGSLVVDISIANVGGVPHVAWSEFARSYTTAWNNAPCTVQVRKLVAGSWVAVGGALNTSAQNYAGYLAMTVLGTTPYVAWQERAAAGNNKIFVKHWNGSAWVQDGSALNFDTSTGEAGRPAIANDGTKVWVGWTEGAQGQKAQLYVRSWNGSAWSALEGSLNADTTNSADHPGLAVLSGVPQLVWAERHSASRTKQLYFAGRDSAGTPAATSVSRFGSNGPAVTIVDNTWTSLAPGGIANTAWNIGDESYSSFYYDPQTRKALVYGIYHGQVVGYGENQNALLGYDFTLNRWDLIEQGGGAWSEHLAGCGHDEGNGAIDPVRGLYISHGNLTLHAGTANVTYVYDLRAGRGKRMIPPTEMIGGPPTYSMASAYDPVNNQILAVGPYGSWLYHVATNLWEKIATAPARATPCLTYDAVNHIYVLFGGGDPGNNNWVDSTVWVFEPLTKVWTQRTPSPAPPSYTYPQLPYMAYDSDNGVSLLMGGSKQVWIYNAATNAWTRLADALSSVPTDQVDGVYLTYNSDDHVFLVRGTTNISDLWAYRYAPEGTPAGVTNTITIYEKAGVTTTNYPIQIGRVFAQSEIASYPQAVVGGAPVTTQADVKMRWGDGSVKHAILSFLIPTLTSNGTVLVGFQNQGSGNNTSLSKGTMLGAPFDFDAQMVFSSGVSATVSARTMVNAWDGSSDSDLGPVKLWTKGPIATTLILADHSTSRVYDVGSDGNRSIRPIFHVTFWPTINKVRVRFVGENANTIALQDQTYNLALKTGNASPQTVYTKSALLHRGATRWTKEYWIGGTPTAIAIDHNLAYVAQTKFVPNYDTSKVIGETPIATEYSAWTAAARDINDAGRWYKPMGAPGGRPDLGPYPKWTIAWLYTGDVRAREMAFGQADLAAAWQLHLREGDASRKIDYAGTVSGLGRVLSICARPTISLWQGFVQGAPGDRVTPVGAVTDGGWFADGAHQPNPYPPQYALTGDFFYLEQMQFWASFSAARPNGAATTYNVGRGPTGKEGGIWDEVRGEGWVFRSRVETAFMSPDGTPEKAYFTQLVLDAIAKWEGQRNITGTALQSTAQWIWGNGAGKVDLWVLDSTGVDLGIPSLRFWSKPNEFIHPDFNDPALVDATVATWMQVWVIYALGRAKELGYPTDALLTWVSRFITDQLTTPSYNPKFTAWYRTPTVKKATYNWYTSWLDVQTGFVTSVYSADAWWNATIADTDQGYPQTLIPAVAMVADKTNGAAAWNYIAANVLSHPSIANDPKWAIVPRSEI